MHTRGLKESNEIVATLINKDATQHDVYKPDYKDSQHYIIPWWLYTTDTLNYTLII